MYRSNSKDEQIKVTEGYREEQNKTVERSQQKEREDTNTKEDNVTSSTKEIENLKKNLKYIKETLKAITSQKWLANKEEPNVNIKEVKKQKKKKPKDNDNTQFNKHMETEIKKRTITNYKKWKQLKRRHKWKQSKQKKQDKSKNRTK